MLRPQSAAVPCPQCRQPCNLQEVSYVEGQAKDTPEALPSGVQVEGNFSTKVDAVVRHAVILKQDEPDVKILVFSAVSHNWEVISLTSG